VVQEIVIGSSRRERGEVNDQTGRFIRITGNAKGKKEEDLNFGLEIMLALSQQSVEKKKGKTASYHRECVRTVLLPGSH